jgi:hypothetical protein
MAGRDSLGSICVWHTASQYKSAGLAATAEGGSRDTHPCSVCQRPCARNASAESSSSRSAERQSFASKKISSAASWSPWSRSAAAERRMRRSRSPEDRSASVLWSKKSRHSAWYCNVALPLPRRCMKNCRRASVSTSAGALFMPLTRAAVDAVNLGR